MGCGPYESPLGAGDTWFLGAYAGIGSLLAERAELDGYALARLWPTTNDLANTGLTRDGAVEVTVGARVKHRFGLLDLRAEADVQMGTRPASLADPPVELVNPSVFAWQGDLEAGVNLVDDRLRIAIEGFAASGDDPDSETNEAFDHLYPTGYKWLGFSDVLLARTNLLGGGGRVSFKITDALALLVDVQHFRQLPGQLVGPTRADPIGLGTEVDTQLTYKLGAGLVLRGVFSMFLPTADFVPDGDPIHFTELELRYEM
jgi:hypothetical protein